MKIEIPYLQRTFPLEFPDKNLLALAEPNEFKKEGTSESILAGALAKPYGPSCGPQAEQPDEAPGGQRPYGPSPDRRLESGTGQSLEAFLDGGKKLLIIINDATRPTPTAAMLGAIAPALDASRINISLIVATGAHRAPTEAEYRQILGPWHERFRERCVHHDARREEDMVDLGTTRNGTPILLNRRLFDADRIIATGSVEPHYFAGFTGGRKAFLPGIAAFRTIEANHKQALSPRSRSLALEGNPVHEDMMDALPLIKAPIFSFMTVLDKEQGVAAATSGDLMASFYAAVDTARKIFCVPVASRADIVVSVAKFPMDIDLYQSQKAIDNGAIALKDGGFLILVSSCRDGIGDEAYAKLLAQASSPADAIERIRSLYKLGYHKAAKMAEVSGRATIKAVTSLSKERLTSMFIEQAETPQIALEEAFAALKKRGIDEPSILVLPDGCVTIPDPLAH